MRALFARLYVPLKLRAASPNTLRLYEQAFARFAEFLGHEPQPADLNDVDVAGFLSHRRAIGRAPDTVEKERDRLVAIWRFLCTRRRLDGSPYVLDMPTVAPELLPERTPQAWLLPELAAMFSHVATLRGMVGIFRACLWWTALLRVAWITGERIGALLQLRWRDFDLVGRWVVVPVLARKGRRRDMLFELDGETVDALLAIGPGPPDALVFPWPQSYSSIWDGFKRILRGAGLPTDRRSKFHRIRRSTASHFEAAGGNATELLGHADRQTTEKYLDPRIVKRPSAARLLPKIDRLPDWDAAG